MENKLIKLLSLCLASLLLLLALSFLAPIHVPYYQDFSVMYFTGKALLNGIPIYSYPAQLAFIAPLTPPEFSFLPYPYPPWYALATLFTGLLPIQVAARMWFLLNLGMLSLVAWLLTPNWKNPARLLVFFAPVLFIPAFGLLVVGQYSAPVLLGAALFIQAAKKKSPILMAAGLLLLTFKPHIGGPLLLADLIWLCFEKTAFARRALILTVTGGLLLAALGFLADAAWPLTYFQSLLHYRDLPGVQTCGLCASLPVTVIRLVTGQGSTALAAWLSLPLALLAATWMIARYRIYMKEAGFLMAVMCCMTLLIDPYLLNYDYVLLLVPLFWLINTNKTSRLHLLVTLIFLLPWGLLLLAREGNALLSLAGLLTFILVLSHPDPGY